MPPSPSSNPDDEDGYSSDHFHDQFWRSVFDGYEDKSTQNHAARRHREGSHVFMALELLCRRSKPSVRHDLESYYWVLLYVVFLRLPHNCPPDSWRRIFSTAPEDNFVRRHRWVHWERYRFEIIGDDRLNRLLQGLSDQVAINRDFFTLDDNAAHMSYDDMRMVFASAPVLSSDDPNLRVPSGDASITLQSTRSPRRPSMIRVSTVGQTLPCITSPIDRPLKRKAEPFKIYRDSSDDDGEEMGPSMQKKRKTSHGFRRAMSEIV